MRESLIEIRMSREVAIRIGAIEPVNLEHYRELRASCACMMIRDPVSMQALFWPIIPGAELSRSSS